MIIRSNSVAWFAAVLLSTLMMPGTAMAQADSRTPEPYDELQLSGPSAALQREAIERLRRRARELAGSDETKFTTLLRQGMSQLSVQVDTHERSLGGNVNAVTAGLDPKARSSIEDSDPTTQEFVRRLLEEQARFNTRMVGAADVTDPNANLETVAILQGKAKSGCSGVVVAPGAVLTAAHCVCEFELRKSERQIVFGNNINAPGAASAMTIPGKTAIFPTLPDSPPNFCADYKKFAKGGNGRICHRDIALVRFDAAMAPANLAAAKIATGTHIATALERLKPGSPDPLLPFKVVGFGVERVFDNSARYHYGNDGRKRTALFTKFFECQLAQAFDCAAPQSAFCISRQEIVLKDVQGVTDSCSGDSGGPAFVRTASKEWRLAGLVSRALRDSGECGYGGIYSYVFTPEVVNWLDKNGVKVTN